MSMNRPNILFVDDTPEEVETYKELIGNLADISIVHPDEVNADRLVASHLVLIDYKIDYWPAREEVKQVGLRPLTGVALAAILRDYVNNLKQNSSPVAFGILSGRIQELSSGLPVEHRRQVLAANNNLEWIFSKSNSVTVAKQAVSLADAVSRLPKDWGTGPAPNVARDQLFSLLSLYNSEWQLRAIEDVERCHPPLHELSEWSHGMAIVRWLLHLILPYPCFLLDSWQLAQRFRIRAESLDHVLESEALQKLLTSASYSGILSSFGGQRWWRSGIESILWDATEGRSFDVPALHSYLKTAAPEIEPIAIEDPVICLDENYGRAELLSRRDAVRIQPDQWPSFAEPAWTSIKRAQEVPTLKTLVVEQDRDALDGGVKH
jgi:hypothetical protein